MPVAFTHSVIPIGGVLIALAEVPTLPERWREARAGSAAHERDIGDVSKVNV